MTYILRDPRSSHISRVAIRACSEEQKPSEVVVGSPLLSVAVALKAQTAPAASAASAASAAAGSSRNDGR